MLRDLVNSTAGLHFDEGDVPLFERRLAERIVALGLEGFDDYYRYLKFGPGGRAELENAVEELTTNETYFMRQDYQLLAFRDEVLPELARANEARRRLVVWSAGCSTGEEAYTLAALIDQSALFGGWDLRVIGSDLSRACLAAARRGVYRPSAFRSATPDFRARYFVEREDGAHVADWLRKVCYFGHLNLLDGVRAATVGRVDAVFCRNVLIYFDQGSRRRVIDNLYERLVPGGYLFLGHSESLLNVSTAFELAHLSTDLAYRKPVVARRGGPA